MRQSRLWSSRSELAFCPRLDGQTEQRRKHRFGSGEIGVFQRPVWRHALRRGDKCAARAKGCGMSEARKSDERFVRIA